MKAKLINIRNSIQSTASILLSLFIGFVFVSTLFGIVLPASIRRLSRDRQSYVFSRLYQTNAVQVIGSSPFLGGSGEMPATFKISLPTAYEHTRQPRSDSIQLIANFDRR